MLISLIGTDSPASHVSPGATFTYEWTVPEDVGPTDQDPDCLTWLYYSAVDAVRDTSAGLVGPLLVCRRGALLPSGKQVSQGGRAGPFAWCSSICCLFLDGTLGVAVLTTALAPSLSTLQSHLRAGGDT